MPYGSMNNNKLQKRQQWLVSIPLPTLQCITN